MKTMQNIPAELSFTALNHYGEKKDLLDVSVIFTAPNGAKTTVMAFWAGGNVWKARYSSEQIGIHGYITKCTDSTDDGLHGIRGELEVEAYTGDNPLYLNGGLGKKTNSRYMTYKNGKPFFWLADTWWMGFCDRISFPDEFEELVQDRAKKGFSAVHIIAGLYPDMHWYDPRGKNPAGFPWSEDFSEVNPAYFDEAEKRIQMLVDYGLTPCIVGCWGYFMKIADKEQIKRHWRYLLARFAAYPVAFCAAGEANMAFYDDPVDPATHLKNSRSNWNEVVKYISDNNPFGRLITIHPTEFGHEQIDDPALLDMDMLQTGHSGYPSLAFTLQMMQAAIERGQMPVINSEACYEGICGSSYEDIQRYLFLSCMFLGAAGHSYGANGIWQLNGTDRPYGPSPNGVEWGRLSWREAAALPGSGQIGACKRYLERFAWYRLACHPEWVDFSCDGSEVEGHFAAGYDGELLLIYKPHFGGKFFGDVTVSGLKPNRKYHFERFNPILGEIFDTAEITSDKNGQYKCPRVPIFGDWLFAFELA